MVERRASAEEMGAKQRDISVSEFFTKNRHLLGFDNPAKAMSMAVREAVDNSLDACEEAGILPTIEVKITEVGDERYQILVVDNGPGIPEKNIPDIFAKLLHGSKFDGGASKRGSQGLGVSASALYSQQTTGKPVIVISKTGENKPAIKMSIRIDTKTNTSEVLTREVVEWPQAHGTSVLLEMKGNFRGGKSGIDAYLENTVVANPHLDLMYLSPKGGKVHHPRAAEVLPPKVVPIKPHPHGVELGLLMKLFQSGGTRTVKRLMMDEFCRVSAPIAEEICKRASVASNTLATLLTHEQSEAIHHVMEISAATLPSEKKFASKLKKSERSFRDEINEAGSNFTPSHVESLIKQTGLPANGKARLVTPDALKKFYKNFEDSQVVIPAPPTDCLVPIGEDLILSGLKRKFKAEFYAAYSSEPSVYRGNPFAVEIGLAFGGELGKEDAAEIMRFSNKVPLLCQPRACGITEAVLSIDWKSYGLQSRKGELPVGPLVIFVHLISTSVPYTSEAKEAVAHYDDIIEHIRLCLMQCGRKLGSWLKAREAEKWQLERKALFVKYIREISVSLHEITGKPQQELSDKFHAALPHHIKLSEPAAETTEIVETQSETTTQKIPTHRASDFELDESDDEHDESEAPVVIKPVSTPVVATPVIPTIPKASMIDFALDEEDDDED